MTYRWKDLFDLALQHKENLVKANIIAILAVLLSVPIPLLLPLLVDEVLLDKPGMLVGVMDHWFPPDWQGAVLYIWCITLLTILLRVSSVVLIVLQTRQFTLVAKDITFNIRKRLLRHIQHVSMSEYETLGSGTVSSRFVVDIETIDQFIGETVSKLIVAVLTLLGVAGILLWLHWQLALFILLLNPLVVYFTVALGKYVKELKKNENTAFECFQQALTETLDAIQQIRASNRGTSFFSRITDLAQGVRDHSARFSWRSDAANRASFLIFISGFDVFRAISMLMVIFSDLSIGEMLAVFSYLWFMMVPVQEVLNIQYGWFGAKAALGRINTLLKLKNEPDYPQLNNPFENKKTVSVEAHNIVFAYGQHQPILSGVNLNIRAGEKIALVGASGGGKSTFVQILLGLYQPQQGTLLFDGVPITQIGLSVVREHVATVLQYPALFNDSIRMNLTLGGQCDESQLWEALEIAQLDETIQALPQKLDTIVGRQGIRLSGGQRQRLAIARMILSKPSVVILDEATSALDTETEEKLHRAMDDFLKNRTTLIVAHRLSAVRRADRIFVFEAGVISEQGSHHELLQQEGLYKKLYG